MIRLRRLQCNLYFGIFILKKIKKDEKHFSAAVNHNPFLLQ